MDRPPRKIRRPSKLAKKTGSGRRQTALADTSPKPLAANPAIPLPKVVVSTLTSHPLLFRKRVDRADPAVQPGDLVAVEHVDGNRLGFGWYNPVSEIAVRMVRTGDVPPDELFWREQLSQAVSLRREVLTVEETTNAYRVVHGEGDGISGIVVDRYGEVLSAEVFSLAMMQRAAELLSLLAEQLGTRHTIIKSAPFTREQEGFETPPIASEGLPSQVTIQEFGTRFRVQFAGGHKTGFFCDQRENRRMLAQFCGGRSVLDLCCYTGGFAIQAKRLGEAGEVTAVDLDEDPLALAKENANLNQVRIKFAQADAFNYLRDMIAANRTFDVVVLDPPKLIRNRGEIEEGTRRHFDLNRLAMRLVAPGGILLTCTCAGLLPEAEFVKLLCSAARQAGPPLPGTSETGKVWHAPRPMQIVAKTGAAADHPVSSNCLETEYLSAVWCRLG